ncbi:MAG: hypothetical protein F4Z01_04030 [Gammaproteobacteria bacterium]|nr:hypothetical protein [Gammaproteobacteria bacterium]MYF37752.1 hypothetical protein [Gammaproteobacteria bacterium]
MNKVASEISGDTIHLTTSELETLQGLFLIGAHSWTNFAQDKDAKELVNWIKVLTLCPEQYSGIEHGARSPVIALVRVLRQRSAYPETLTAWIKQHSTNRFLPYGSVADRLR